ncbi:MAG: DNA-binding protein Alba [Candidatus Aenigmarchaeota archaeon]|nr:DNA-binding protein Alba [Candidatus Aenigmarchaeota archaeon]
MAEEKKETKKSKKAEENMVFVGKKPSMSYVLACVTQFNNGMKEIHLRARGKSISRAVDVAEIVRNRFVEDAKLKNIEIGTDEINTEEGGKINVSTIDITMGK